MLPVWKVDNDSGVPSSQNSSRCMLAIRLDPGFIKNVPGCCLGDQVGEHILNLGAWEQRSVNYEDLKEIGSKREGMPSH